MRAPITIIQVAAALFLVGCSAKEKKSNNFSGTWESAQWGVMTLQQSGTRVVGQWEYQNGRLEGDVADGKLTFKWWQNVERGTPYDSAPVADRGDGYFVLSADAESFTGKWRLHGWKAWKDDWDAIRVLDPRD